jgi:hypothetical protein
VKPKKAAALGSVSIPLVPGNPAFATHTIRGRTKEIGGNEIDLAITTDFRVNTADNLPLHPCNPGLIGAYIKYAR